MKDTITTLVIALLWGLVVHLLNPHWTIVAIPGWCIILVILYGAYRRGMGAG